MRGQKAKKTHACGKRDAPDKNRKTTNWKRRKENNREKNTRKNKKVGKKIKTEGKLRGTAQ